MTRAIADEVKSLLSEVPRLVDERKWRDADRPSARLLELLPDRSVSLGLRAVIDEALRGPQGALPLAIRSLDIGDQYLPLLQRLTLLLRNAGDHERAETAAAYAMILGGPPIGYSTRASRRHVFSTLDRYVSTRPSPPSGLTTIRGLARARLGDYSGAFDAISPIQDDTVAAGGLAFPVVKGLIAYRAGKPQLAREVWSQHAPRDGGAPAAAFLALSDSTADGVSARSAARKAVARSDQSAEDAIGRVVTRAASAIIYSLSGDPVEGAAVFAPVAQTRPYLNIVRMARAATAMTTDALQATSDAIAAAEWDETGDLTLPWYDSVADKILERLNLKPRSLAAAHGCTALQRARSEPTVGRLT